MNTGGSLPDLTNLHFPPPLPTPLDPEETAYPSLSGGSSTSNLAHTMTHLGISGGLALGPGSDAPGEWLSWLVSPGCCLAGGTKGWEARAPRIFLWLPTPHPSSVPPPFPSLQSSASESW